MSAALKKSNQTISEDSHNATSSPALGSGATLCDSQDGPTLDLFGQEVAPVQASRPQGKAKGLKTLATSGLVGLASSESQDLQRSLESRLIRQLDSAGSTLFKQTWKRRVTPLGRRYLEHTASARRTSDNGFTSLPTPAANEYEQRDSEALMKRRQECKERTGNGNGFGLTLGNTAMLASVPTPMAGTPAQNGYNEAGSTDYSRKIVNLASVATPTTSDDNNSRRKNPENELVRENAGTSLAMQAFLATVTTPTAQDHSRGNKPAREWDTGVPLSQQAALATVSTPSSRDWKDSAGMSETGVDPDGSIRSRLDQLPRQAQLAVTGPTATGGTAETGSTGQLAPDYSRWLQGLPEEWASCADMAMPSVRRKRKPSSKPT